MLTSAGMPSADRCQDLSICLKAAFSFAFCGSLLLCSEHHFCAPLSKMTAAQHTFLTIKASGLGDLCATSPSSEISTEKFWGMMHLLAIPHHRECDDA